MAATTKTTAKAKKTTIRKKKARLNFTKGVAHIHASYSNTIVSISDEEKSSLGLAQELLVIPEAVNPLRSLLSLLQPMLPRSALIVD